jgi:hypothetical protein
MDDVMLMAGNRDQLSFAEMREEEQMIVKALEGAKAMGHDMLHISDLQDVNGWDGPTGNSKVRNNLRRLMRYGWIHRVLDGTYALINAEPKVEAPAPEPEPPQPVVQLVIEPPQPVVRSTGPLVQIRKKNRTPNPIELSSEDAMRAHYRARVKEDYSFVEKIKRPDCTFYNACLDQAIAGLWAGFSCTSCSAYALPDRHQQEIDLMGCLGVNKAREMLEEHGKLMRVRGVKPGADAKRTTTEDVEDFAEAV